MQFGGKSVNAIWVNARARSQIWLQFGEKPESGCNLGKNQNDGRDDGRDVEFGRERDLRVVVLDLERERRDDGSTGRQRRRERERKKEVEEEEPVFG